MNSGRIQQVGSAHDIYNDPANQFVAQFIGSPSTNVFEATVVADGDGFAGRPISSPSHFPTSGWPAPTSPTGSRSPRCAPGYIELNSGASKFSAEVSVVEPRGDTDAVYLMVDDEEIRAITSQGEIDEDADSVSVDVRPENVWVFDSVSGDRLL